MNQTSEVNECNEKANSIIKNFSSVLDKLPKKPIEKKTYLACYISDNYIKEFSLDDKNELLVVDFMEGNLIKKQNLNETFTLIETENSFYIAARDTQIKKGEAFIACTKSIPENDKLLDFNLLFLDEKTDDAIISGMIHSKEKVSNLAHIADNIYAATLGDNLFTFIIGYNRDLSKNVEINKSDTYDNSYY